MNPKNIIGVVLLALLFIPVLTVCITLIFIEGGLWVGLGFVAFVLVMLIAGLLVTSE